MPKLTEKKRRKGGATTIQYSSGVELLTPPKNGSNGSRTEHQYRINPETPEQREKRLEKRKALTLKVFKWAYDNNESKA